MKLIGRGGLIGGMIGNAYEKRKEKEALAARGLSQPEMEWKTVGASITGKMTEALNHWQAMGWTMHSMSKGHALGHYVIVFSRKSEGN